MKKTGHKFITTGLDPAAGKERIDIQISSRHDLMDMAKQKVHAREYPRDMVWTPEGFKPLNPNYLAAAIASRKEQQEWKQMDDRVKRYSYELEEKIVAKYYEVPVKDPLTEALAFAEPETKQTFFNKITDWFKK